MAELRQRLRFRGDPGEPGVCLLDALAALLGPVRDERVVRSDRRPRTPRVPIPRRWFHRNGVWDVVPRGYRLGEAGNLISAKRALRRQLEREHGPLTGRQWRKLRRVRG